MTVNLHAVSALHECEIVRAGGCLVAQAKCPGLKSGDCWPFSIFSEARGSVVGFGLSNYCKCI